VSCHQPQARWTITRRRTCSCASVTAGPIPSSVVRHRTREADVSTVAARRAYNMLGEADPHQHRYARDRRVRTRGRRRSLQPRERETTCRYSAGRSAAISGS
jgi:hypothetical protein